jgi:hypothetical protein
MVGEFEVIQTINAIMLSSLQVWPRSLPKCAEIVSYAVVLQVETALSALSAREPSPAAVAQFQTVAPKLWDSLFKVRPSLHLAQRMVSDLPYVACRRNCLSM